MKKNVIAGFCGVSVALVLVGAVTGACSSASDDNYNGGFAGDAMSSGVGPSGPSGTTGPGGFSTGAGGSSIGQDEPIEPPPLPRTGEDAGTDAGFVCEGLDQTKPVVLYLSADDSNSMASPAHAREILNTFAAPPPKMIRTYEFLNYYRIAYNAPPIGQLSIFPQMADTAVAGEFDLQLGVRSFDAIKPRRPITVTFVLDTSGSMQGTPIQRERAAATAIVKSLMEGDIVSMVTWNTSNNTILNGHVVTGPNDPTVLAAINKLEANGGTNLHNGLVEGYKLAKANYGDQRLNRMVLISDGGANVGVTDEEIIAENSLDADKEGVYLVGIGTGHTGGYNDLLMDVVTDKGRGAYIYLDSEKEADHMFVDRFDETMEVAARSVQVEVTLPWYFKIEKFYGEEFSENPDEIEPQHLAPSDAMIFAQVVKACDASVVNGNDTITVKAKWVTPITYLPQETEVTTTVDQLLKAMDKKQLIKGKAIVAYAEALKVGTSQALKDAHAAVTAANPGGLDKELTEIAGLIQKHPNY
jgi:Ca-activated chloride channel homolog